MQIVIDVTEAEATRVHNALCVATGTPVANAEGAKEAVVAWIEQTVLNVNRAEAASEGTHAEPAPVDGVS